MIRNKYNKTLLFLNFFPIFLISIISVPFWITGNVVENFNYLELEKYKFSRILDVFCTKFEILFNYLNPLYLLVINIVYNIKIKQKNYIENFILILFSSTIGITFYYINWGMTTNMLLTDNLGNIIILLYILEIIILIMLIGILEQFTLLIIHKFLWKK